MKNLTMMFTALCLIVSSNIFAATTTTITTQPKTVDQQTIQMAKKGCQKPLGFFPTPSKLTCLLTAIGKSEKDIKPKAMAIIFSACQGHLLQPQPNGTKPKKYATLAACLNDPIAIEAINKELGASGFSPIAVANPSVISN